MKFLLKVVNLLPYSFLERLVEGIMDPVLENVCKKRGWHVADCKEDVPRLLSESQIDELIEDAVDNVYENLTIGSWGSYR